MERSSYTYRFGTAEFDEARFELRVAGLPVDVEPRALEVLVYLLRHVGEVVSKEELLSKVWAGRVTVEKVLPNAINKLRRALGAANAEKISTQLRIGYRLDGPVTRMAVGIRQISSEVEDNARSADGKTRVSDFLDTSRHNPVLSPTANEHFSFLKASALIGRPVPGRDNFILQSPLGERAVSDVWLAVHVKTREKRVYKFAANSERLRDLKREVTVSRLLHESVQEQACFVEIIDWNFESAPYFLECEYGGINLIEWAAANLVAASQSQRIALFLQIADAVASAHAVGVLHKDLKPANILVESDTRKKDEHEPQIRLTDFGNASLLDPERLEALGITRLGMTLTDGGAALSGTPLYIAPELFSAQAPTAQSDVFALGIILYQLISGRIGQPMVSGWEAGVSDLLLREDLHLATNENRALRFASAAEFAARLRDLDARHLAAQRIAEVEEKARIAQNAIARSRAKRPYLIAVFSALTLGLLAALNFHHADTRARDAAQTELARASALSAFLNEDLISRANPFVAAKGPDAVLRDVLLAARARVTKRFENQPNTEATIRASLGGLFESIDLWAEAEIETRQALMLYASTAGDGTINTHRLRSRLIRVLCKLSRFDDAAKELGTLQRDVAGRLDSETQYLVSSAVSTYHVTRGEYALAVPKLENAVQSLIQYAPEEIAQRDALRTQLILAYTLTENYTKAQAQAAALITEAKARPEDSEIAIAFAKLAVARSYSKQKQNKKALELLLEAEPIIVGRFGKGHSRHLLLLGELLGVAFREPDWPKALIYAETIYTMLLTKMGRQHSQTQVALVNWGRALYESGSALKARMHLRNAYEQLISSQGMGSTQSQDAAYALASVELELNNLDAAQELINTLDTKALVAAAGNKDWSHAMDALRGLLLLKRGELNRAGPLLKSALDGLAPDAHETPDRIYQVCKQEYERAFG